MPNTLINARVCRKCGAAIAQESFCAACLLEMALADEELDPGTTPVLMDFGDYELLEELGRGGQGVVYRARQKVLNRTVALKIIGLGHWATEAHLTRFRMEAEAAAQLDHPGIVPIYEIGERDGACFFSMKFIEGAQLDALVRQRPLSMRESAELMAKVARTVHFAHEHGVLHRDLKPGNILVDRNGEPHLTDFGLAKLVESDSAVTNTFDVLGTPSYMAPEQAAGKTKELTAAADVYGLGAVVYQLLTGQPPFAGGTTYETIRLVMETEPRRPILWNSKVDRDLETIALKCLAKDPQKRYSTALALAEDLERWLRHEPVSARRIGVFARTGKWVRRSPATALLVPSLAALIVALSFLFWKMEPAAPPTGLAVLPFENLSEEKADTFFVDTLQDDVLTKLAKVADLKVISRTSVMGYRGERNIRKIGNALRVSHILEGSVYRVDGRVRVNAQLIDARSDTHVWAETYERARTDLFALESELAQAVAARLKTKVSHAEKSAMEAHPTADLEAYDLYLRGTKLLRSTNMVMDINAIGNYEQAVDLLEQAVARDPAFSLAWTALAEACLSIYWTPLKPREWRGRAEAALAHAVELAPDAGETRLARALLLYWGYRDYDRALEQLELAARVLPNNAQVYRVTSWVERRLSRWKDSLRHSMRAVELDPRDPRDRENLIRDHRVLRRYREAIRIADQALADFPENDNLRVARAQVSLDSGDLAGALAAVEAFSWKPPLSLAKFLTRFTALLYDRNFDEAERWAHERATLVHHELLLPEVCFEGMVAQMRNDHGNAVALFTTCRDQLQEKLKENSGIWDWISALALADAARGNEEEAVREQTRALTLPDQLERQDIILNLATIYCWLGRREQALGELEKLVKTEIGVSYGDLKFNPYWDSLREDPRFEKILAEAAKPML